MGRDERRGQVTDAGDSALNRLNGVIGFTNRGSRRGRLEVRLELTLNKVEGYTTVSRVPANLCYASTPLADPYELQR